MSIVINLHVTEACNMKCQYCFARWSNSAANVFEVPQLRRRLIKMLAEHFLSQEPVRFNFVGGEPAMLEELESAMNECKEFGGSVSAVTNGLLLSRFAPKLIASKLEMIGVSIDSDSALTLSKIGRTQGRQTIQSPTAIARALNAVRRENPSIQIKLNTVVSEHNWDESLSRVIELIQPNKWKVFRVLPVYREIRPIADDKFWSFVERHRSHWPIIAAEDNEDMIESYIMINPTGRFFQNQYELGRGYKYSRPILTTGVQSALQDIEFDHQKFVRRYESLEKPIAPNLVQNGCEQSSD